MKYDYPVINKERFRKKFPRRSVQVSKPKIIISGIRHFESFIDAKGEYIAGKSTLVVFKKESSKLELEIILPILNSRLIRFYIKENYSALGIDGGINFTKPMIEELPIPTMSEKIHTRLIELNTRIQSSIINDLYINNNELKDEIDQLVYELYGLTPEEIAVVEGTFKK